MKATLIATFTSLLLVGCGSPNLDEPETLNKIIADAIDADELQKRGAEDKELYYAPNVKTPYTGWVKSTYTNGKAKGLVHVKEGKKDGFFVLWYENGRKEGEGNWKDDKLISVRVWRPNGEKCLETIVDNGNGVWVVYKEDNIEKERRAYKDSNRVWN